MEELQKIIIAKISEQLNSGSSVNIQLLDVLNRLLATTKGISSK